MYYYLRCIVHLYLATCSLSNLSKKIFRSHQSLANLKNIKFIYYNMYLLGDLLILY